MNEKDLIAARDAASARLRRVIDPQRRSSSSAANGGGGAAGGRAQVPRWKDGSARDPIVALEEELDLERYKVDGAYQARPDVHEKMNRLITLRAQRDQKAPPPPTPGPSQEEYEKNREQIIADAKKAVIDRDIERRVEQRKSMETVE